MVPLFDTEPELDVAGYAHVAPEQGLDPGPNGLTYAVPPQLSDLQVGERVLVPLGRGNKPVHGYVIALSDTCDLPPAKLSKLKQVASRDASAVSLTPDLIELAQWMSSYYCCPLGMVLVTMLPAAVKHGTGNVQRMMVRVTPPEPPTPPPPPLPATPLPHPQDTDTKSPPASDTSRAEQTDRKTPSSKTDDGGKVKLTKLQRAVLDEAQRLAKEDDPWVEIKELADAGGARTTSPVRQLIEKGLLITETRMAVRADAHVFDEIGERTDESDAAPPRLVLTLAQDKAITHLADRIDAGFGVYLLHGVTGSGKTEVYLRVMEHLIAQSPGDPNRAQPQRKHQDEHDRTDLGDASTQLVGKTGEASATGAIVLVPEIALTPQTVDRFKHRFDDIGVAVLHSGLTASQRHHQWQRIRRGEARIVVGARSAIFAPLPNVGLIIVDEEHESSYKQDQLPRYHARDVAVKRGHLLGAPVVLGSATPSLESYFNATQGRSPDVVGRIEGGAITATKQMTPAVGPGPKYHLLELPERVAGLKLPKVQIIDMAQERRKRYEYSGKSGVHLLSVGLETQLRSTLEAGGQAMLLLNRRGYANYIACPDHKCAWMMKCDYCDATMVYHKDRKLPTGGLLRCHHCGAEQILPVTCPQCDKKVTVFGLGTQRVEEEIQKKFPDATWARMDSDTMRTGHDYHATLSRFRCGQLDILIGTQMIAKGLDFPNVRLVGVISADTSLNLPDFRAAERTFQLIAQVAGRAGRGEDGGKVVVQTFNPEDPNILLAAKHDYPTFAEQEIELRRQVGLPPVTRMARIVTRDRDFVACVAQAKKVAAALTHANQQLHLDVRVRGPVPCPIARVAEFHRQQIELIAPDAPRLQKLMTALRNERLLKSDARTAVDVDPVALM